MNSINKNQPEENFESLAGSEAVKKIQELAEKAQTCFLCTSPIDSASAGTRPMSVRKVDDEGNLWFLSANDSHANEEIAADPNVRIFMQGSPHSDFLHLSGLAQISTDRAMIEELWDPMIKTWFTEGKDDPRIAVIKVAPNTGYYWDTKHGNLVAGVKIMIGAAIGKTLDDSIEGPIQLR